MRLRLILSCFSAVAAALISGSSVAAHAPSVVEPGNTSPGTAHVLDDPTLSRALGATLDVPGEVDWYRMDLLAGDALVVEVTAPDAVGGIATSFTILGPGLGAPPTVDAAALASLVGAEGAIDHAAEGGAREVHGGLGFIAWGGIRTTAPADGTYWIAVRAATDGETGKYVLAPGVREEFGADAIGGMADLIAFFNAPWPPVPGTTSPTAGVNGTLAAVGLIAVGLIVVGFLAAWLRRRRRAAPHG